MLVIDESMELDDEILRASRLKRTLSTWKNCLHLNECRH